MKELVLHIGMMKTATTYLQSVLQNNRDELSKKGWLYPGEYLNHQREIYGLCGNNVYWYRKILDRDVQLGCSLVKEIKASQNSVIISSEALSSLSEDGIKEFVDKVGRPTRVVVTVRNLYKVLPSAWQQYVKGGSKNSFEQMLDKFIQARQDLSGPWRTYAYGHIIKKWSKIGDVHTVIIPTSKEEGGLTTWDLFQQACGLPSLKNTEVPASQSNLSLPLEGVNFLIEMNKVLDSRFKLSAAEKVKVLNSYLRNQAYPSVGKIEGNRISPPSNYIEEISAWEKEEIKCLKKFSSAILGSEEDLCDYINGNAKKTGSWGSSKSDMLHYITEQICFNNK